MKVWWCEEHKQSATDFVARTGRAAIGCYFNEGKLGRCRMVEMQLVPADALVIEKENSE